MNETPRRIGGTMVETLAALGAVATAAAITLPVLSHVGSESRTTQSLANVTAIGVAHAVYSIDWNGRQVTWIPDDFSTYGPDGASAWDAYEALHGAPPYVYLGWGCSASGSCATYYLASYGWIAAMPLEFDWGIGSFRMLNMRPMHDYLDGRVYSPIWYPPNDEVARASVVQHLDDPDEYVPTGYGNIRFTTYCASPAAMYDPAVFRAPSEGGWQDPFSLEDGFESPALGAVLHPSLKTLVLEHHWLQNRALAACNDAFIGGVYGGCEPYYFNHAWDSAPVTVFYDLSARLLPNAEAFAADEMVAMQTGEGLWSRDTPFGTVGYFGGIGYDDLLLSHHVLTIDGIRGRDTVAGAAPSARSFAPRSGMSDRAVSARRRAPGLELRATTN